MRIVLLHVVAAALWTGNASAGDEQSYPRPDLLLGPAKLAKPDVAKQFVILDVRKEEQYRREHLPGALRVDHDAWKTAFGDGKDADGWSKRIGSLGISGSSKVVVYDDNAMKDAARIWWILQYWGVKDARLLDGGWKTWKAKGYPTTAEVVGVVSSAGFTAVPRVKRLTTKTQLLALLERNSIQIVDTRSEGEFCGIEKRDNKRGGAIPGAKHLEWKDVIDQETHRFKSPNELRQLFDEAGVDLERPSATHCQSGGRASVMAFAMELMGASDIRNYYRGWSEWGNADDTPVDVPTKKTKPAAQ
ncbi:MAG: sulfurtransferase [Planctomycetes bacterium]|nr:sulfurtransferase [Planctomycetota bacterium]MBL7039892.1 sulfurtransferase [Pirellulaceae bacterium]